MYVILRTGYSKLNNTKVFYIHKICLFCLKHRSLNFHFKTLGKRLLFQTHNSSNHPYLHWYLNTTDTKSPTCFNTSWLPSSGSWAAVIPPFLRNFRIYNSVRKTIPILKQLNPVHRNPYFIFLHHNSPIICILYNK